MRFSIDITPSPPWSQFGIGVTRTNNGHLLFSLAVTWYINGQWSLKEKKGSGPFSVVEDPLGGGLKVRRSWWRGIPHRFFLALPSPHMESPPIPKMKTQAQIDAQYLRYDSGAFVHPARGPDMMYPVPR